MKKVLLFFFIVITKIAVAQDTSFVKFNFAPLAGSNHIYNWQLYPFTANGYTVGGFFNKTKQLNKRIATTDLAAKYIRNNVEYGSVQEIKRTIVGFTGNYRYSNTYMLGKQRAGRVYAGFAVASDFMAHASYDIYTSSLDFYPKASLPVGGSVYFQYKWGKILLHNSTDFYVAGIGLYPFYKDFRISPTQNIVLLSPLNYQKLYNRLSVEIPVHISHLFNNTLFISYIYTREHSTARDNKLIYIENNITVGTVFRLSKYFN